MKLDKENAICPETVTRENSFFGKMKKLGLISSYDWSIFYKNKGYKKEEEAFLLMGSLPHEVGEDLGYYNKDYFKEDFIQNVNMEHV